MVSTLCDSCGHEMQIGDFPFCPHGSVRAHHIFPSFEVEIDGHQVKIDSIHAAQSFMRERERMYRDGARDPKTGQPVGPIAFRAFEQDSSNQDRNCFGRVGPPKIPRNPRVRAGAWRDRE